MSETRSKIPVIFNPFDETCPSRHILEVIGSKWSILLLCSLQKGPVRTLALMREVQGISQKMLTQTLRELQSYGIVERRSYPEVPPRVEYYLTELGTSLARLVRNVEEWVVDHAEALSAPQRV